MAGDAHSNGMSSVSPSPPGSATMNVRNLGMNLGATMSHDHSPPGMGYSSHPQLADPISTGYGRANSDRY